MDRPATPVGGPGKHRGIGLERQTRSQPKGPRRPPSTETPPPSLCSRRSSGARSTARSFARPERSDGPLPAAHRGSDRPVAGEPADDTGPCHHGCPNGTRRSLRGPPSAPTCWRRSGGALVPAAREAQRRHSRRPSRTRPETTEVGTSRTMGSGLHPRRRSARARTRQAATSLSASHDPPNIVVQERHDVARGDLRGSITRRTKSPGIPVGERLRERTVWCPHWPRSLDCDPAGLRYGRCTG